MSDPNLRQWNDARLDDLHEVVRTLAARLDATATVTAANNLQLVELDKDRKTRADQKWALYLVVLTVMLTSIGGTVANLINNSPRNPPTRPIVIQLHYPKQVTP